MSRPPNLLFVFTDEQRADTLRSPHVRMPRLNALADTATVFANAHCVQPVCTPSRGCLMTGRWPWEHGAVMNNVPLRPDARCLPELLPAHLRSRYRTAYLGKWHLGDEIFRQHGFDAWCSLEDGYEAWYSPGRDRAARSDYHHWLVRQGFKPDHHGQFSRGLATELPEPCTKPHFLAGETVRFLREHRDTPFLAVVNFLEPHMPFFGRLTELYDPATLALPENFDAPPGDDCHLESRLRAARWASRGFERYDLATEAGWRQMTAAYRGLCTLVDRALGRILDELASLGLEENTIVVFTSDHGEMMGSHRLLGKSVMYRESTGVPLLVRLPGQRRGRTIDTPVSQIDLVPTLLELLGAEPDPGLPGRSLAPVLRGASPPADDVVVLWDGARTQDVEAREDPDWMVAIAGGPEAATRAYADPLRTLITPDGWRYTHSPHLGQHELYDWNTDPHERRNLARDPAHGGRLADLRARLAAWQRRVGDPRPAVA